MGSFVALFAITFISYLFYVCNFSNLNQIPPPPPPHCTKHNLIRPQLPLSLNDIVALLIVGFSCFQFLFRCLQILCGKVKYVTFSTNLSTLRRRRPPLICHPYLYQTILFFYILNGPYIILITLRES